MGIQGGFSTIQNHWEDLTIVQPGDQSFPANTPVVFIPQIGTGIYLNNPKFYVGLSMPELVKFKGNQYELFFGKKLVACRLVRKRRVALFIIQNVILFVTGD